MDIVEKPLLIKDLVILGQAAPVEISKGRKSICTAGWPPTHEMIRLYPIPVNARPRWWKIVEVPVVRNKQDVRYESWKIHGSKGEWDELYKKIKIVGELKSKSEKTNLLSRLIKEYGYGCVNELNKQRGSLGFITPKDLQPYFTKRTKYDSTIQTTLDSDFKMKTSGNYPIIPKIKYRCSNCIAKKGHNQQVLEWGAYEGMKKNPDSPEKVWENYHIGDPDWEHYFLVGNMAYHLTRFMIISIFRFKKI